MIKRRSLGITKGINGKTGKFLRNQETLRGFPDQRLYLGLCYLSLPLVFLASMGFYKGFLIDRCQGNKAAATRTSMNDIDIAAAFPVFGKGR